MSTHRCETHDLVVRHRSGEVSSIGEGTRHRDCPSCEDAVAAVWAELDTWCVNEAGRLEARAARLRRVARSAVE